MRLPSLRILFVSFLVPSLPLQAATIDLVGSDLLKQALQPALKRYEAASGNTIAAEFIGTLPALNAMAEGRAKVAIIAIPTDDPLPEDKFQLIPLAYQVGFVIVNAGNPVVELSLPQLSGIFSSEPQMRIDRWAKAGISGGVATRTIQIFVQDVPGSIVVEMFKYIALNSHSIQSSVSYTQTIRDLCDSVSADVGAIGLGNQEPVGKGVKAVAISTGESDSFAFGPTPENVYYGDYLLRLPFYIAVPKSEPLPKPLIKELLSPETATELDKAGFMPLPENVRKRAIQDLDR